MRPLTEAMRAATAEPPPTSIVIDQIVVRERRRRTRLRLVAVAGVTVVLAGAVPALAAVARPDPAPPPPVAPEPTLATPTLWDLPHWTARAATAAAAALPDGTRMAGDPTEYWAAEFALMWADLVHPGGGRGQLLVYLDLSDPAAVRRDSVCGQPRPELRFSGRELACVPIQVDGVALRQGISRDVPPSGDPVSFPVVTHYRDGSTVHLWELPYPHPLAERGTELEPAGRLVLGTRWLAELALDPALAASRPGG